MSAPPPASVRLAKLRTVVAREGRDDVQQGFSPPEARKSFGNSIKQGEPAKPAATGPARVPAKSAGRSLRSAMLIAILAWTLIMPVALVVIILVRQGEGALPNLALLTIIRSGIGGPIVNSMIGLWVIGLLYLLPSIVAGLRQHPFFIWILLLDILTAGLLLLTNWAFALWAVLLLGAIWTPGQHFHAALGRMLGAGAARQGPPAP
jgi:hypothetical protein